MVCFGKAEEGLRQRKSDLDTVEVAFELSAYLLEASDPCCLTILL